MSSSGKRRVLNAVIKVALIAGVVTPVTQVVAQAETLLTGANSLVDSFTLIAMPIAILAVMVVGLLALFGRLSWGWPLAVLLGIGVIFGAPQLVDWSRGLFGV